jgi:hypothetical protein
MDEQLARTRRGVRQKSVEEWKEHLTRMSLQANCGQAAYISYQLSVLSENMKLPFPPVNLKAALKQVAAEYIRARELAAEQALDKIRASDSNGV